MDFQSFAENLRNSAQEDAVNLLLDFSGNDPETLLEYAERLTDDQHSDLLKMLQGFAYHALSATAWNAGETDKALDFLEKALVSCIVGIDRPAVHEKLDSWALALGAMRPGRPQEILKRTKLKYLGNRIYPFNDNFSLSEEGLAPFANIWLSPSKIVKSAVIFSKILGQGSGRQLRFLLYDMENPWNEIGGGMAQFKTDYLDIATITLDGTVSFESQKSSAMQKEQKIISSAKKEIEYKEQQEVSFAKAEVERREQIRIRDEEHREQILKDKERQAQIKREREKFWQGWFSRNRKIITISWSSIIFIASIATFLWYRNLKIKEEQIRIARETAENLAQKFVKENIITCNGFSYIKINNVITKLNQDIQVAIHEADENWNFASFEVWSSGDDLQYEDDKGWVKNDLLLFGMIQKYGQWIQKDIKKISCSDIREITVSKNPPLPNTADQQPKNLSSIHYKPEKTDAYLPGRCLGTIGSDAQLEKVGLTNEMLKAGVQCVAGDFDGNGYLDFALYGSKVSKLKHLERDYRIIFFDQEQVIFISQIRNVGEYGEPLPLQLYYKGITYDKCPKSKNEGLYSPGAGEFNTIYLFDKKKKIFAKFSCPSGE